VTPGGELRDCMERLCRFLNRGLGLCFVAVAVQPSGCGAPGVSFPVMPKCFVVSTSSKYQRSEQRMLSIKKRTEKRSPSPHNMDSVTPLPSRTARRYEHSRLMMRSRCFTTYHPPLHTLVLQCRFETLAPTKTPQ